MAKYHLIGIGGTGLSAIARVLFERGESVSGSDTEISPLAQELIDLGIPISIGHDVQNIRDAEWIIRSSAITDINPEVKAARERGIPVLKRMDFLQQLTENQKVVAIAGTHGKTTTTGMIAFCLEQIGLDPSYVVGSPIINLNKNAHAGSGEYFVIEADEYDHMFLGLRPEILVITNIEHDHPDCYPTIEEYFKAFENLVKKTSQAGYLIMCGDHPGNQKLLQRIDFEGHIIPYGENSDNLAHIKNIVFYPNGDSGFRIAFDQAFRFGNDALDIRLPIPGNHNILNATAAACVLNILGIPGNTIEETISSFEGTSRRFDIQGEIGDITVIDDYAHHPTEIQATLSAARKKYPSREIWAVWQPHTYSRTEQLFEFFIQSFHNCDHLIVTDIYASREKKQNFHTKSIIDQIRHKDATYIGALEDATEFLLTHVQRNAVIIVLSAGDANQISQQFLKSYHPLEGHK